MSRQRLFEGVTLRDSTANREPYSISARSNNQLELVYRDGEEEIGLVHSVRESNFGLREAVWFQIETPKYDEVDGHWTVDPDRAVRLLTPRTPFKEISRPITSQRYYDKDSKPKASRVVIEDKALVADVTDQLIWLWNNHLGRVPFLFDCKNVDFTPKVGDYVSFKGEFFSESNHFCVIATEITRLPNAYYIGGVEAVFDAFVKKTTNGNLIASGDSPSPDGSVILVAPDLSLFYELDTHVVSLLVYNRLTTTGWQTISLFVGARNKLDMYKPYRGVRRDEVTDRTYSRQLTIRGPDFFDTSADFCRKNLADPLGGIKMGGRGRVKSVPSDESEGELELVDSDEEIQRAPEPVPLRQMTVRSTTAAEPVAEGKYLADTTQRSEGAKEFLSMDDFAVTNNWFTGDENKFHPDFVRTFFAMIPEKWNELSDEERERKITALYDGGMEVNLNALLDSHLEEFDEFYKDRPKQEEDQLSLVSSSSSGALVLVDSSDENEKVKVGRNTAASVPPPPVSQSQRPPQATVHHARNDSSLNSVCSDMRRMNVNSTDAHAPSSSRPGSTAAGSNFRDSQSYYEQEPRGHHAKPSHHGEERPRGRYDRPSTNLYQDKQSYPEDEQRHGRPSYDEHRESHRRPSHFEHRESQYRADSDDVRVIQKRLPSESSQYRTEDVSKQRLPSASSTSTSNTDNTRSSRSGLSIAERFGTRSEHSRASPSQSYGHTGYYGEEREAEREEKKKTPPSSFSSAHNDFGRREPSERSFKSSSSTSTMQTTSTKEASKGGEMRSSLSSSIPPDPEHKEVILIPVEDTLSARELEEYRICQNAFSQVINNDILKKYLKHMFKAKDIQNLMSIFYDIDSGVRVSLQDLADKTLITLTEEEKPMGTLINCPLVIARRCLGVMFANQPLRQYFTERLNGVLPAGLFPATDC